MSDWKYTFEPVSKATWLKQIESDLHPKGIDSIQSEWWEGETLFPAFHAEDSGDPIILPESLFNQPPRILEWINTTIVDAKTANKLILDALHYGAQSINLHIDPNHKIPYRLWLDGVFSEMIDVSISLTEESSEIIHTLREIVSPATIIRLYRLNTSQLSSVFLKDLQGSIDETANSFRFVYEIPSTGQWTQKTAEIFRLILSDLTFWKSQGFNPTDFLDNCILQINPDSQYFKQLIQTRALHILWNNIWKQQTKSDNIASSSYLECHIIPDETIDPDQYTIRASASAVAASLTGVHALCIHHLERTDVPNFYSRVDRNIHHLLNMESGMYKGTDPLSGSYTIDYYTRKWTEDIWRSLQG